MAEEQLRKWVESIPKSDLNKPVMVVDGKYMTPIEIATEINKKSDLGMRALKRAQEISGR